MDASKPEFPKKVLEYSQLSLNFMHTRVKKETKQKVDSVLSTIKREDNNIPSYFKVFNFQGQKSPLVAKKVIEGLTTEGETILDPFFGTGAFVVAAASSGRSVTGIELDNYTFNIVKTLLTKIDIEKFEGLFHKVSDACKHQVMSLYETKVSGRTYYVHKIYFDPITNEYFNPKKQRDISRLNGNTIELEPNDEKIRSKKFEKIDLDKIEYCNTQLDVSRFPHNKFIENSRINITARTGADFYDRNFTNRAKYALLSIQDAILALPKSMERDTLEFALVSSLALSKIAMYGDGTDNLYHVILYTAQERNVWTLFCSKVDSFIKYKKELSAILQCDFVPSSTNRITLIQGDYKKKLCEMGKTFDCIYTDPPYTDQVPYIEKSQYFRDWLKVFYDEDKYSLTQDILKDEIVVSNAPSRPEKNIDNYFKDIDEMFSVFSKYIKTSGFLVLTLKLGTKKYFNVLTKFINYAKKNGFEYIQNYSLENTDPTIRKQAAYLSTILKQTIVVFQKLPTDEQYWFIGDINVEQQIEKIVYEAIDESSEKYIDLTDGVKLVQKHFLKENIVFNNEQLEKVGEIIKNDFSVFNHSIQIDPNSLYLGLEDNNSLLLKLYDTIPVIIKNLLDKQGSFVLDDLYSNIAYMVFDGDASLTDKLLQNEDFKNNSETIVNNYCDIVNNRYVKKSVSNEFDKDSIDISTLDGYELERLMVKLLGDMGYINPIETGKSGDMGVDLIAQEKLPDGSMQKVIFQCKRWIGNVGSTPIQRLHSMMVIDSKEIKRAVCITTSSYTRDARKAAQATGVELIDGQQLLSLLQKQYGKKYYHGALALVGKDA